MPADNLDSEYLVVGICISCGNSIFHSPIRMPISRPMINPEKPGHFGVQYGDMCIRCIRRQLNTLEEKIDRGEMYPTQAWEEEEEGGFRIVSIAANSIPEQPVAPEPEPTHLHYCSETPTCKGGRNDTADWEQVSCPECLKSKPEPEPEPERIGLIRLLWKYVIKPIVQVIW